MDQSQNSSQTARRKAANAAGHAAEWLAAGWLLLKGYRILGRRYRVRLGEVDLIAAKGGVVTFVEVKMRRSIEDAQSALTRKGCQRSRSAASRWLSARPRYLNLERRFDAVLIVPWRWPVHLPGAA